MFVLQPFRYGGCNGNSNNFLTTEQCRQTCPHPTGPPFPARTCPLCSKHLATAFCSESFVVAGYVKGISPGRAPSPSRGRTITLHITRVFSDREDLGLVHLLAAAYYRRPVKRFKLATTPHCPCPDFKTLVHQEEIAQTGVSRRCGQSAGARSNGRISSRCTELLISGRVVDGVPTIGQGSLAVTATSVNLARMMSNRNQPNFCRIIKAAERQQQVLDRASRMLGYKWLFKFIPQLNPTPQCLWSVLVVSAYMELLEIQKSWSQDNVLIYPKLAERSLLVVAKISSLCFFAYLFILDLRNVLYLTNVSLSACIF